MEIKPKISQNLLSDKVPMRWNRYVYAINYCISLGYDIDLNELSYSLGSNGDWNGNIKSISVRDPKTREFY